MGRRVGGRRVTSRPAYDAAVVRRLIRPALATAAMLAITLGLGIWQVERLAWKTSLLAGIDRAEARSPLPLPDQPEPFQRVVVEGRFLPSRVLYGVEVRGGAAGPVIGAQLVSALVRPGKTPVLVDRGWVPDDWPSELPSSTQRVEGYVRAPEKASWSNAKDDPSQHRVFTLDPQAIGRDLGLAEVAPFTVVALGAAGGLPQPATGLPRPPNDHLSYAATWFSLSAALMIVFVLFVRQTLRQEPT